jgi:hypothetical protein
MSIERSTSTMRGVNPRRAHGPTMLDSKGDAIVEVGSVGGVIGAPGLSADLEHARRHRPDQERRA